MLRVFSLILLCSGAAFAGGSGLGPGKEALEVKASTLGINIPIERHLAETGKYFFSVTEQPIAAITETPVFLFRNPSGNTKKAYLQGLNLTTTSIDIFSTFRFYRNPTVSNNGTGLTEHDAELNHPATSEMTTFSNPTITSNGTLTSVYALRNGTITVPLNQGRIFGPNTSILITVVNSAILGNVSVRLIWVEE